MLHKTEGIVLSTIPYSDVYSITQLYTRDFGRTAYLLPRPKRRKTKLSPSLFSPLSVLRLEVDHKPLRDIQRIKEATRQFPLYEVGSDMTKISLAFFLSELLVKLLQESERDESLFEFLTESIKVLEAADRGVANFHLAFMVALCRFLGIEPNMSDAEKGCYFDLMNGEFKRLLPLHSHFLDREQSAFMIQLQRMHYGNMHLFRLSRLQRNQIVDLFLDYYRLHTYHFSSLKSLEVLRTLV